MNETLPPAGSKRPQVLSLDGRAAGKALIPLPYGWAAE